MFLQSLSLWHSTLTLQPKGPLKHYVCPQLPKLDFNPRRPEFSGYQKMATETFVAASGLSFGSGV